MLSQRLKNAKLAAISVPFNPEEGLTLTRTQATTSSISFTLTERQQPIVMAADITFPAVPANGSLFKGGNTTDGAFVGLRNGGSTLRIRAGAGTLSLSSGVYYIDVVPPTDTLPHTLVWEFNRLNSTVKAWLDGVELLPLQFGGGSVRDQWSRIGGSYVNAYSSGPSGEPTTAWPGTAISGLRIYANQTASTGPAPTDTVTFSNTSPRYNVLNNLMSPLSSFTTIENIFVSDISCAEAINIRVDESVSSGLIYKIKVNNGSYTNIAGTFTLAAGTYNISIAADAPYPIDRHTSRTSIQPDIFFNNRNNPELDPIIRYSRNLLTNNSLSVVIPAGVTSVDAVAIGSGPSNFAALTPRAGSGGGALSYVNALAVTPGETLTVVITDSTTSLVGESKLSRGLTVLVSAQAGARENVRSGGQGGQAVNGVGTVKYSGGNGGDSTTTSVGGSGGAAGYSGNGGNGASGNSPQITMGSNGSGGGGAGGSNNTVTLTGSAPTGGGVGVVGEGVSGLASTINGGRGSFPGEDGTTQNVEYGGGRLAGGVNGVIYFSY